MWTALRADRTGGSGGREPIVAVASWAGLDIFRPIAALYAAQLAYGRREEMVRPWLALVVIGLLMAWSLAMLLYRRRTVATTVLELTLAAGAVAATALVESPENIAAGVPTLPTMWAAGSVLGAAVLLGVRGGLIGAVVIGLADLFAVGFEPTSSTLHNIVLLLLLGGLFGLAVDLAREGQSRLEAVLIEQERLKERERLSRVVHDGVLQALAFIHRRGSEIGGESAQLAQLAAEQERSLRELITRATQEQLSHGDADLRLGVSRFERPGVSVSAPAQPLVVSRRVHDEILAAVGAAVDNVGAHAGEAARTWILLEKSQGGARVTIRDNGVGMDLDRLADAAAAGRLGVARSIRGRVEDLGGTASWSSRPGAGCTVILEVPVAAPAPTTSAS